MERQDRTSAPALPGRGTALAAWAFGLVLLAAVLAVVLHATELEDLVRLLRAMQPGWLLAGLALQGLTYVCAAAVWRIALAYQGYRIRLTTLLPMALAMLFTNQAVPSGGVAGSIVVVRALRRRHVPADVAMSALLVGLVTMYHAYLIALVVALPVLHLFHVENTAILGLSGLFALAAVGLPAAVLRYWNLSAPWCRRASRRVPALGRLVAVLRDTRTDLPRVPAVWWPAVGVQIAELLLDAATLQAMLAAIGVPIAPTAVFGSYVVAAAVSRIVPVPLGLGSFEATLMAMLHLVRVPLEAALAATILFRGLTMWLPMLPGLWCVRRVTAGLGG